MISGNVKVVETDVNYEKGEFNLSIDTSYLPYTKRYITQVFPFGSRVPIEESYTENYHDAMNNHWDLVEQHSQGIEK